MSICPPGRVPLGNLPDVSGTEGTDSRTAPVTRSLPAVGAVLESVPSVPLTSGKFPRGTRPGGQMDMSAKSGGRRARPTFTDQEALQFHQQGRPGKIEVVATKPMATQRDLSLAYSPGVAVPV